MKKIYLSYILFITLNLLSQQVYFSWEEIQSPTTNSVKFLKVDSRNSFIIENRFGEVYEYSNGNWRDHQIKTSLKLNPFIFFSNDSLMLCAAVDQKWHTHFFRRQNGKWNKYKFIHDNPIIHIFSARSEIFATGSWGSFLRLGKTDWELIETPFKNHIHQYTVDSEGKIWLGVLSDDIFMYDHSTFYSYAYENNLKSNLYGMRALDNGVIEVVTENSIVYKLENGEFVKSQKLIPYEWSIFANAKFGFRQTEFQLANGNKLVVKIPIDFQFTDHIFRDDSTLLLTNREGKILIGTPSAIPQFVNLAAAYNVGGSPNSNSTGAFFADINSDDYPDLFVFNGSGYEYSNFFINNPNAQFTDGSATFEILLNRFISNLAIEDMDNDGLRDVVISGRDTLSSFIQIYKNTETNSFKPATKIHLPKNYYKRPVRNINIFDMDADGDLDLNATEYYGDIIANRGGEIFLENKWFADQFIVDTTLLQVTTGWNEQSLFADFNGDDQNEIYIANEWGKNKLLFNHNDKWIDEAPQRISNLDREESDGAAAFDYDNDGDLDILTLSDTLFLSLFENNGSGYFQNVAEKVNLNSVYSPYIQHVSNRNLCLADINNDGYTDIFITLKDPDTERNFLLINVDGKYFTDKATEYGIVQPAVNGAVAGDIDNDGDIDLYGFSSGKNLLWINTLDNQNFIKIKPRGVLSNSMGVSAKIWLYEIYNNERILRGYKQLGTDKFSKNQYNDPIAHFGVNPSKQYKAVVKFYGGDQVESDIIQPGSFVTISETGNPAQLIYGIPGVLYRFFSQQEVQFNLLVFAATIVFIYLGTLFGIRKFKWSLRSAYVIGAVHLFLFWVIYVASSESQVAFIKYLVPLIVLGMGLLFTNVGYYWSAKTTQKNTALIASDELLSLLRNFTHGEWASRNLNSLILFFKNWSESEDQQYNSQLKKRIDTYKELTRENINKIFETASLMNLQSVSLSSLSRLVPEIDRNLNEFEIAVNKEIALSLANNFEQLKFDLKDIQKTLYTRYTCDPLVVINELSITYEEDFKNEGIDFQIEKEYQADHKVLIRSFELADIIDNLITNAIRSFKDENVEKKIEIRLLRKAPKIQIEVANNGRIIPQNEYNKIFSDGFSKSGSSGSGLSLSQKILDKYGGSLKLNDSNIKQGTVFSIDLHEG